MSPGLLFEGVARCHCHCLFLDRPCPLIALTTCLKGHKGLRVLCASVFQTCGEASQSVSQCTAVNDKVTYWAVWGQLKKEGKKDNFGGWKLKLISTAISERSEHFPFWSNLFPSWLKLEIHPKKSVKTENENIQTNIKVDDLMSRFQVCIYSISWCVLREGVIVWVSSGK